MGIKNRPIHIGSFHGMPFKYSTQSRRKTRVHGLITFAMQKHLLRKVDHLIGVSERVAKSFSKHFGLLLQKLSTIYNPIPGNQIKTTGLEDSIHPWFSLGNPMLVADMPGYRTNPFSFLGRSQLFVMSLNWEGFGNAIVEALVTGTPVVSTDCHSTEYS